MSVDLKSLEKAGFTAGPPSESSMKDAESKAAAEESRRVMLTGVLTTEALERLSRVALVKPENARAVEDHIIRMARTGKISAKITDDNLIRMLEEVGKAEASAKGAAKKITITRKKRAGDDDDDDEDDDF